MTDLVCFDLGGVLVRITLSVAEAAVRAGLDVGLNPTITFPDLSFFNDYQAGRIDDAAYLATLGALLGVGSWQAQAVHNHILIEPYAGTFELIEELSSNGVRTGCLSNTNALHWAEMRLSGRFPNVQAVQFGAASQELQLEKPDARIYRAFEAMTGASPSQIVFFDDGPANVEAARSCGWRAELIDPSGDPASQMRQYLA